MLKSVNSILQHHKVSEETMIMEQLTQYEDSILEMMAMEDIFERPGWKGEDRQAMWRKLGTLEGPLDQEELRCFGTSGGNRQEGIWGEARREVGCISRRDF